MSLTTPIPSMCSKETSFSLFGCLGLLLILVRKDYLKLRAELIVQLLISC